MCENATNHPTLTQIFKKAHFSFSSISLENQHPVWIIYNYILQTKAINQFS